MKSLLLISALSLALPAHAVKSWATYFWHGTVCNSDQSGQRIGPNSPKKGRVCYSIPNLGYTSSMDLYTNEDRWPLITMGLHKNSDCSDDGGIYEADKNQPTCIRLLDGQVAYSITTRRSSKRSVEDRNIDAFSELQADDSNQLESRDTCKTAAFSLTAGIAASHFWYSAAGTCPATATDGNINHAQCALASVFGVTFTTISAFAAYGAYHSKKRSILTVGESHETLADGMAMKFTRLEDSLSHPYPTDDGWTHYQVDAVDLVDGYHNYTNVLSFHKDGAGRVTHPLEEHDESLQKRKSKYTAYYAWTDGDTNHFKSLPVCTSKKSAKHGAEQIYNYGHGHDSADFCANMVAGGYTLTHGNFAVVDGTFTDYSGRC